MSNPCPTFDCPCDSNPLTGYSSEVADVIVPLATAYVQLEPPLGTEYCARGCVAFASPVMPPFGSGGGGGGGGGVQFFSTPQAVTITCPDGTPLVFEVTAGAFTGATQAAADAAALAYGTAQANLRQLCLGVLSPTVFTSESPYSGSITASGGGLGVTNTWTIISGSLPTGLTFNGGVISGNTVTITGTPTVSGVFTFQVQLTNPTGETTSKLFTLSVYLVTDSEPSPSCLGAGVLATPNNPCNPISACAGYSAQAPIAPYVVATGTGIVTNNGYVRQRYLTFSTAGLVVWNYQFSGTGGVPTSSDPGNVYTNLFLNFMCPSPGVNPVVAADGTFSVTGSFATTGNVPFEVMANFTPQTSGTVLFEFYPSSNCTSNYVITQGSKVFVPTSPDAPNDTAFTGVAELGHTVSGTLDFFSNVPKTWNYVIKWFNANGGGANGGLVVTVNGSNVINYAPGALPIIGSFNGSFNTTDCVTPSTMVCNVTGCPSGSTGVTIEWQTPP